MALSLLGVAVLGADLRLPRSEHGTPRGTRVGFGDYPVGFSKAPTTGASS